MVQGVPRLFVSERVTTESPHVASSLERFLKPRHKMAASEREPETEVG